MKKKTADHLKILTDCQAAMNDAVIRVTNDDLKNIVRELDELSGTMDVQPLQLIVSLHMAMRDTLGLVEFDNNLVRIKAGEPGS